MIEREEEEEEKADRERKRKMENEGETLNYEIYGKGKETYKGRQTK